MKKSKLMILSGIAVLLCAMVGFTVYALRSHVADKTFMEWNIDKTKYGGTPADTMPPEIKAFALEAMLGETPDYRRGVKVLDGDKEIAYQVDSSKVDVNKPGDYPVYYTAVDSIGNTATVEVTATIIDPNQKIIYLTFDDGPSANTERILKILRDEGVHATFFVTAQFKPYLHFIKQEAEEGHAVAAHTYSHDFRIYRSVETYFEDLEKIEKIIEEQTGKRTPIIRFPGGSNNTVSNRYNRGIMQTLKKMVIEKGYQYVDWNLDSSDATGNNVPVSKILASACHDYQPQQCLLMHDTDAKNTTVEALPQIIKYFKDKGYVFGTITRTSYVCHFGKD